MGGYEQKSEQKGISDRTAPEACKHQGSHAHYYIYKSVQFQALGHTYLHISSGFLCHPERSEGSFICFRYLQVLRQMR